MEKTLLDFGFSWTMSKVSPYLLMVFIGFLLSILFYKKLVKNKILKISISLIVLFLPFGIYFIFFPIFQGDFSNNGKNITQKIPFENFKSNKLIVVAMAGCPYCFESISDLKILKQRNSKLKIEYVVCTEIADNLIPYKQEINNSFPIRMAKNKDSLGGFVGYRFPSFIYIENSKPKKLWRNDDFGSLAKDYIEEKMK